MRAVFGLFGEAALAEQVVADLDGAGFGPDAINIIVQEKVAQAVQPAKPAAAKRGRKAAAAAPPKGLPAILANHTVVREPEAGPILAANAIAQHVAATAPVNAGAGGLKASLENMGVDAHLANAYAQGVNQGMWLLFLNTPDERAFEASSILDRHAGRSVFIFTTL